jgi:16S rRNA processing protein RimM
MTGTRGSGDKTISPEPDFLIVARVLRAWGIRGDLKIQSFTDRPDDFVRLKRVYIGSQHQRYEVQSCRPYQGNWLLHLAGVDSRTDAEMLRGQTIAMERAVRPLDQDEYYAHQIIGLKVKTIDGDDLGVITEIIATGANDVYVVHGERGEVLLPARSEIIRSIDLAAGMMIVELLSGL